MNDVINYALANPVLPIIFIVLLAMLLTNIISIALRKYEELDVAAAVALMNSKKVTILDVRNDKERKGDGYINRDKHIRLAEVAKNLADFEKDKPILVYCKSGMRSASIAQLLGKAEFEAYNLKGGFNAWVAANMPIAKK